MHHQPMARIICTVIERLLLQAANIESTIIMASNLEITRSFTLRLGRLTTPQPLADGTVTVDSTLVNYLSAHYCMYASLPPTSDRDFQKLELDAGNWASTCKVAYMMIRPPFDRPMMLPQRLPVLPRTPPSPFPQVNLLPLHEKYL